MILTILLNRYCPGRAAVGRALGAGNIIAGDYLGFALFFAHLKCLGAKRNTGAAAYA